MCVMAALYNDIFSQVCFSLVELNWNAICAVTGLESDMKGKETAVRVCVCVVGQGCV